jgi:hypothetical protein
MAMVVLCVHDDDPVTGYPKPYPGKDLPRLDGPDDAAWFKG